MTDPDEPGGGRFAAIRGKITPRSFERADSGGTVGGAQGSAEGVGAVDERDQESLPGGTHELASEVSERVRSVISAAEAAGNAVRHEAEQAAQRRRRIAEEEATRIVEDATRDADAYLEERRRRIAELSDTVVERAEKIVAKLDRAEDVRKQLQGLADALGESAEELAVDLRNQVPPVAPRPAEGVAPPGEATGLEAAVGPEAVAEAGATEIAEPLDEQAPPAEPEPPGSPAAAPPEASVEAAPEVVPLTEAATATEPLEQPAGDERREPDDQLSARLVALQMAVAGGNRGDVEVHIRQTFGIDDPSAILDDVFGPGSDSEKRVAWPQSGDSAA